MDRLQIVNAILSKLGEEEQLDDPDADTRACRAISANWDSIRDQVLRVHPWNFAIDPAGAVLTADAAYNPAARTLSDHGARYLLPNDFIRLDLQRVRPESVRDELRVGGRWVYAGFGGPIMLSYVRRVASVGEWDPLFADAFACKMAAEIGPRITGDKGTRGEMMQLYRLALAEAKAVDGRDNPPEDLEETSWVTARYDSSPGRTVY